MRALFVVLGALVALWAVVGGTNLLPWDWLYTHRWSGLAGSCVLGLLFSLAAQAALTRFERFRPRNVASALPRVSNSAVLPRRSANRTVRSEMRVMSR